MNFSSASKVRDTLQAGDQAERARGENRVLVNQMFNGFPYLDDAKAKRWNLRINCNFGEAPVLAAHARRQYDNAILGTQNFFKVSLNDAPPEHRTDWGSFITTKINRCLKQSEEYACLKEYQFASVVAHGIGPQIWHDDEDWMPDYVAVEDLRVPTDTKTSFKDMPWFAVRHFYTPGELAMKVFGKNSDPSWNKEAIKSILHEYDRENFEDTGYTWLTAPEKRAELWKQNIGYWCSDKAPSIILWHFYFQDDENSRSTNWKLRVIPDWNDGSVKGAPADTFLYDAGKKAFAKDLANILCVQFGDLNNKSPFMYHSVRSLGFLLMEPCFWTNLARCRGLQHLMESFNVWLRVSDPAGRARAQKIELFDRCILEEGVSIVPQTERHQIDPRLLESMMAQLKQLQAEASQSYTQSLDTGTKKEQTAFETRVKLSAVNAMMTGLLGRAFRKEVFNYREIGRRFCLRRTSNADARRFQSDCKRHGIPSQFLNVEYWDIQPETPLGGGNPTMAMSQAEQLMAVRPLHDPQAQQEILHIYDEAVLNDASLAERLVPINNRRGVTDGQSWATSIFGTLMNGLPVPIQPGLNMIDQIETLLGLLSGRITLLEKTGNVSSQLELIGLQATLQYISQLVEILKQNPQETQRVKEYSDALGKLANTIKGFAQRLQEQMAKQNGQADPEAMAKVAALKAMTEAKITSKTQADQHKLETSRIKFESEEARKDAKLAADLQRQQAAHEVDLAHESEVVGSEVAGKEIKTAAEIQAMKKKASAAPKKTD